MRQGRSSSKDETNSKGMEIEKVSSGAKLKEEPHLSGAYIRSLVKQLTSSKTKDSNLSIPKDPTDHCNGVVVDGHHPADTGFPGQNLTTKLEESLSETKQQTLTQQTTQPPPPQQQQQKKQVRRRLHTSRPYQERLLNMAEARREIVTALKFHRAAMKQANEQQQQQQHQQQQEQREQPVQPQRQPQSESLQPRLHFEPQEGKIKSRRNHRIYPSNNTSSFSNYLDYNFSSYSSNFSSHHHLATPNPLFWPANSPIPSLPFGGDQYPNFTLPNQALGLNLNFHDFNNIDTSTLYNHNSSFYSASASASATSPSSSSSHSPSISAANDHDPRGSAAMAGPAAASSTDNFVDSSSTTSGGGGLHAAMDDEEMAEIRSLGEQHQMEWNDTMNLVTSAYWLKFLKADQGDNNDDDDDNGINGFKYPFDDQVMEFPAWLSSNNESCLHQQHFDDYYCSDEYLQSPALPCMDIGEIEAMDGDCLGKAYCPCVAIIIRLACQRRQAVEARK